MLIAGRKVGAGEPCYLVAEVGINHNGDVDTALRLVNAAAESGADAVKFQVGDPERYVNPDRWDRPRETPWGVLPYIEYRKRMELQPGELARTKVRAESRGLHWFASPLDTGAVDLLEELGPPAYKIASPKLTDEVLLDAVRGTEKPAILSTGMSTEREIRTAHTRLPGAAILHCTSAYPCPPEQVNLRMLRTLQSWFPETPVGFSDHTVGVPASVAAVSMGACIIERHLTLSRAMWGSDHAASLEPAGFAKMAKYIRTIERSMGDGEKRVYESEQANLEKFRVAA